MIKPNSYNLSELERLEKKYENQIKLFPESNSFVLLAEILLKQNKIEKAIGVLIRGLVNNNENITARFLLAKLYYQTWKIDLAKKELKKVISLSPDNYASTKLLIEIYKSDKEYDKAIEVAKNLTIYYENDDYLINEIAELKNLADFYNRDQLRLKYKKKDSESIKTANDDDNNGIYENETVVDLYISQGLYKDALKILNMLIIKEPANLDYQEKHHKVMKYLERLKNT
ncbi:MAG: hypothetical protein GTO02_13295 [Candidatus Dadabacteria bacterium]|nr:hypothetical protein [Candidatus Dadabacteria bacterium]NIQ15321.1 hypothetical protein [Candidatus Dadabacteria bacterium]